MAKNAKKMAKNGQKGKILKTKEMKIDLYSSPVIFTSISGGKNRLQHENKSGAE